MFSANGGRRFGKTLFVRTAYIIRVPPRSHLARLGSAFPQCGFAHPTRAGPFSVGTKYSEAYMATRPSMTESAANSVLAMFAFSLRHRIRIQGFLHTRMSRVADYTAETSTAKYAQTRHGPIIEHTLRPGLRSSAKYCPPGPALSQAIAGQSQLRALQI